MREGQLGGMEVKLALPRRDVRFVHVQGVVNNWTPKGQAAHAKLMAASSAGGKSQPTYALVAMPCEGFASCAAGGRLYHLPGRLCLLSTVTVVDALHWTPLWIRGERDFDRPI